MAFGSKERALLYDPLIIVLSFIFSLFYRIGSHLVFFAIEAPPCFSRSGECCFCCPRFSQGRRERWECEALFFLPRVLCEGVRCLLFLELLGQTTCSLALSIFIVFFCSVE